MTAVADPLAAPIDVATGRRLGGMLAGAKVAAAGISAAWLLVAARALDVVEVADLTLALALGAIVVQVADGGLSLVAPAEVGRRRGALGAIARAAAQKRAMWGLGACVPFVVAFLVVAQRPSPAVALAFSASFVATAVHSVMAACLRADGRVALEVGSDVAGRLVVAAVGTSVVLGGGGLLAVAITYAAVDVAVVVLYAARLARAPQAAWDREPLAWRHRRHLAWSVPLATVTWRMDIWFLALLSTPAEVARYGLAYRLLDTALLPALSLASLLPAVAATAGATELWARARRVGVEAVASVVPFVLVSLAAAEPLLRLLFGEELAAGGVLRLLALASVPTALVLVATQVLATTSPRTYARAVVVVGVGSAVLCATTLGTWGAAGAGWITLGGQAAYAALLARGVRRVVAERRAGA